MERTGLDSSVATLQMSRAPLPELSEPRGPFPSLSLSSLRPLERERRDGRKKACTRGSRADFLPPLSSGSSLLLEREKTKASWSVSPDSPLSPGLFSWPISSSAIRPRGASRRRRTGKGSSPPRLRLAGSSSSP
ncbi:hypothetical protein [Phaffia rhodozyma]|uniref:Uncharacterized protein n=1 Tax=Phaffia rhodozyma TaxID=264483 RepID=A0A0F7SGS8_PHARH|nr:hypothetical protein [Phaffia rhodozyma]